MNYRSFHRLNKTASLFYQHYNCTLEARYSDRAVKDPLTAVSTHTLSVASANRETQAFQIPLQKTQFEYN